MLLEISGKITPERMKGWSQAGEEGGHVSGGQEVRASETLEVPLGERPA